MLTTLHRSRLTTADARSTPASRAASSTPASLNELNVPAESVEFTCAACGEVVRAPARAAGKKGKCPRCRALTPIPETKSSQRRDSPARKRPPSPSDDTLEELPELSPADQKTWVAPALVQPENRPNPGTATVFKHPPRPPR